mmetsp:Transcript_50532/g.162280  ORF Transcript_50532/g.162280 Transcript_50532/m.162280 type:complete len:228 (-) Transcript_50532:627-1310(-)
MTNDMVLATPELIGPRRMTASLPVIPAHSIPAWTPPAPVLCESANFALKRKPEMFANSGIQRPFLSLTSLAASRDPNVLLGPQVLSKMFSPTTPMDTSMSCNIRGGAFVLAIVESAAFPATTAACAVNPAPKLMSIINNRKTTDLVGTAISWCSRRGRGRRHPEVVVLSTGMRQTGISSPMPVPMMRLTSWRPALWRRPRSAPGAPNSSLGVEVAVREGAVSGSVVS